MPLVYGAAASHAPGLTAWSNAVGPDVLRSVHASFEVVAERLEAAEPDCVFLLTSEHWNNFFLHHISAFCLGRGATFEGPVEPWLKVEKRVFAGAPDFAKATLDFCYANGFELGFSDELVFDHGSVLPLRFLTKDAARPVVPLFFNTLAAPRPSAARCVQLGRILRAFFDQRPERIAVIATGGMSHDPGEINHGVIDTVFDQTFLDRLTSADLPGLESYSDADLLAAGAGTLELLAWTCLAGMMHDHGARRLLYDTIPQWATGFGVVDYGLDARAVG